MSRKANKAMKRMPQPEAFERVNSKSFAERHAKSISNTELFKVNKGTNLRSQRAKLSADRFEEKQHDGWFKSATEQALIFKMERNKSVKAKKVAEEYCDPWATPGPEATDSRKAKEFKSFKKVSMPNVKQVMLPEGGQSFNPKASDHKKVL
jgi:hypothetical protein